MVEDGFQANPEAQNSTKAQHYMVFGPKNLGIRVLRAFGKMTLLWRVSRPFFPEGPEHEVCTSAKSYNSQCRNHSYSISLKVQVTTS